MFFKPGEGSMTTDHQAALAILEYKIKEYLREAVAQLRSLSAIREAFHDQFRHPDLTIWAPEIHGGDLVAVLIENVDGEVKETYVGVPAADWCDWERGIKKPLAC
jgi:hypothetical protein